MIHDEFDLAPSRSRRSSNTGSGTNRRTQTFTVFGVTRTGEACKRCMMQNQYCYQHVSQDPSLYADASRSNMKKREGKTQRCRETSSRYGGDSSRIIYGITSTGEACKRCIKQDKFCYQHVYQSCSGSAYTAELDKQSLGRSYESSKTSSTHRSARTSSSRGDLQSNSSRKDSSSRKSSSKRDDSRRSSSTAYSGSSTQTCHECAICMEKVKKSQLHEKLLCCRKKFHSDCLDQWRRRGSTCPMCREPLL